ncbi:hypothetical protein DVB69_04300 [Sporosarcina sp. BI001-red]|uniref:hypothetical protein n=1 Tax=Sporosarcina sp. BI001-red TaxID=2282866 RepID=UPI000E241D73|nr:hypothetical protein [Sporosarcina sp. BI001-red]REB10034.1 hypothetical protein DVB69_04300 [Sporosarcina sp. BI001-red]
MMKNKVFRGFLFYASATFIIISVFAGVSWLFYYQDEVDNKKTLANQKKSFYDEQMKLLKEVSNDNKSEESLEVAMISYDIIKEIERDDSYYQRYEDGNEYLEKLEVETTKRLNDSLEYLLGKEYDAEVYGELMDFYREIPDYISKENSVLLAQAEKIADEELQTEIAKIEEENKDKKKYTHENRKRALQSIFQTGMSVSEVKSAIGPPTKKYRSDEAEFWNYEDAVILTIKNGFVYDITYPSN